MDALPTRTAKALAMASNLNKLFEAPHLMYTALGHFQRIALVSDYDTAIRAFVPHINHKLTDEHVTALKLISSISSKDILGIAVDSLLEIAESSSAPSKERIAAATVLNELYGEKELVKDVKLTDRLMINLVGDK